MADLSWLGSEILNKLAAALVDPQSRLQRIASDSDEILIPAPRMPKEPSGRGRARSTRSKHYGLSTSVTISSSRGVGRRANTRTVPVGDLTKMPREEAEKYFRDPDLVFAEADRKRREAGRRAEQAKDAERSRMAASSSRTDLPAARLVKQEEKPLVINARPVGPTAPSTEVKTEPDVAA
ncbi:hypothetical protein VTO73DRAFT_4573 [Trametes versicolor]